MFLDHRQDPLYILRIGKGLFDIPEGQQLLTHDPAQAQGDLLLLFRKDALQRETHDPSGMPGMKEKLEGHPDRQPVDKSGNKGDRVQPPSHSCHSLQIYR